MPATPEIASGTSVTYETVIGLEIHVQLKTRAKVFAPSAYLHGGALPENAEATQIPPNTLIDPVVLALPGALPVLNRAALEQAVRFGLLTGAAYPADADYTTSWDRKNYFYPDSTKAYQITQKDHPISPGGSVEIELPGPARNIMGEHKIIRLNHAHLEEDVGKLTHAASGSLVDYNRAGAALLEIVTEPDLRSSDEAVALLNALRMLLSQAGISDCDMEKGQMRCDANVSVRPLGQTTLNTRTEMKNLNSISGVKNAIEYEARRQTREYEAGRSIEQETRAWNAETGRTYTLRSKEDAHDYRYFPDPDLMPARISPADTKRLSKTLPERPYERQRRYFDQYQLPFTTTSVLIPDLPLCEYFEAAAAASTTGEAGQGAPGAAPPQASAITIANLIANELLAHLSSVPAATLETFADKVPPASIAGLAKLIDSGHISKQQAKEVFAEMLVGGDPPAVIVERKGLRQNNDTETIEKAILAVLASPSAAKTILEFKSGNEKALNSLKGPVMKATQGKANPKLVDEILRKHLA